MPHYPLYLFEVPPGPFLGLTDHGITLADGAVSWRIGGRERRARLADLSEVRLAVAPGGGSLGLNLTGQCALRFSDRTVVTVTGSRANGSRDADQAETYRHFVRDLHAQIPVEARAGITFFAGRERGRGPVKPGALWFAAAVIAGTAIWLTSEVGAIGLIGPAALAGIMGLILLPLAAANTGKDYDPGRIPDQLTPR